MKSNKSKITITPNHRVEIDNENYYIVYESEPDIFRIYGKHGGYESTFCLVVPNCEIDEVLETIMEARDNIKNFNNNCKG